jgi:ATP-dependent RNA helicase SUPV3L1/SUV3
MPPVIAAARHLPAGYRPAGAQAVRLDIAEKLLRAAHEARVAAAKSDKRARHFALDPALATSTGLRPENWARLLGAAGFKVQRARTIAAGALGPPAPDKWTWRPARRDTTPPARPQPREGSAFSALADLVR